MKGKHTSPFLGVFNSRVPFREFGAFKGCNRPGGPRLPFHRSPEKTLRQTPLDLGGSI